MRRKFPPTEVQTVEWYEPILLRVHIKFCLCGRVKVIVLGFTRIMRGQIFRGSIENTKLISVVREFLH